MFRLTYPLQINSRLQTTNSDAINDSLRQLIEQILLSNPGERVNRPDFGAGLMHLVFAGTSQELLTANEYLIKAALQRWLANLVIIEAVATEIKESTLLVTIRYRVLQTDRQYQNYFSFDLA